MRILKVVFFSTQVKRIVITSSVAAIMSPPSQPTIYTEKDWNTVSIKEVEELGDKSTPIGMYRASKTLAEQGERVRNTYYFKLLDLFLQLHGSSTKSTSPKLYGTW